MVRVLEKGTVGRGPGGTPQREEWGVEWGRTNYLREKNSGKRG